MPKGYALAPKMPVESKESNNTNNKKWPPCELQLHYAAATCNRARLASAAACVALLTSLEGKAKGGEHARGLTHFVSKPAQWKEWN